MSEHRIIPMQCGDNESYALLFHDGTDSLVVDIYDAQTKELVQTVDTPFPRGSANELRYVQSFDVVFFAQGDTHPCKLKRENKDGGGYEFSFEDNKFNPEPIMDWDTNSEHIINVFALPDMDLLKANSDGSVYYPKGVVREYKFLENIILECHGYIEKEEGEFIRYFAKTSNFSEYNIGDVFELDSLIRVRISTYSVSIDEVGVLSVVGVGGELVPLENEDYEISYAILSSARVESHGDNGVYFILGKIIHTGYVHTVSGEDASLRMGKNRGFYRAIKDAPMDVSMLNTDYYTSAVGSGFDVALTIDGSNTNENIDVGQIVSLRHKSSVSLSESWDYEDKPVGTEESAIPAVQTLERLPSKEDAKGNELRPESGGGFGAASEWVPIRGEVELETKGLWSGVIELQELDANSNVSTVATITSENGNSNTSLTREITEFGSSVRVACVRREKAYQVNRSVKSDGDVIEKVLTADEGLQWTLTTADAQTAYLRIKEKRTLTNGINCYIAEVIGGVIGPFSSNTYALGAWSSKNGYPRHIAIFQERLVYSGNKTKPTTLWLSKTNNWEDFELGVNDSSSITATLATEKYDRIQWLIPNKNGITLGTNYGEYSFGASDGGIVTSDNARATATSNIGSIETRAEMFGTAMVMVKTGGEELYRIDYNTLSEEAAGNQISLLAKHLFEGDPVIDMFAVKAPSNMLFCLHGSGKLSSLTYEPDYGVTGWARHEILDGVESGCVIRRSGKDVLCLVAKRGGKYVLGEIDLQSEVWTDDEVDGDGGVGYESKAVTTPMTLSSGGSYGKQVIFAGCDIYADVKSKRFDLRLNGGDWIRVDNGFNKNNELRDFDAMRIEIPATSAWVDEAIVEIKSSYAFPLVLYAVGASIKS